MIDYEDLILQRQEDVEIAEDNYGWEYDGEIEEHYNPILMRELAKYEEKSKKRDYWGKALLKKNKGIYKFYNISLIPSSHGKTYKDLRLNKENANE